MASKFRKIYLFYFFLTKIKKNVFKILFSYAFLRKKGVISRAFTLMLTGYVFIQDKLINLCESITLLYKIYIGSNL